METVVMISIGLLVALFVLYPMRRSRSLEYDWDGTHSERLREQRRARVEADVARYRTSLRCGTICTRCGQANPGGSRFCGDCGSRLQNATRTESAAQPVSG
jgi:hypothetical protein